MKSHNEIQRMVNEMVVRAKLAADPEVEAVYAAMEIVLATVLSEKAAPRLFRLLRALAQLDDNICCAELDGPIPSKPTEAPRYDYTRDRGTNLELLPRNSHW